MNLCLTLVTFGIFSAWAKVRKKRYIYSHTTLGGTPFQYLARPIPILKGRLIAAAGFGVYFICFFPGKYWWIRKSYLKTGRMTVGPLIVWIKDLPLDWTIRSLINQWTMALSDSSAGATEMVAPLKYQPL